MFLGSPQRAKLTSGGSFDRSSARTATASFPRCGVFYVLGKPAHILSAAAPVLRVVHEGRWISLGSKLGVAALYLEHFSFRLNLSRSLPGLTRQSIFLRKWMGGGGGAAAGARAGGGSVIKQR